MMHDAGQTQRKETASNPSKHQERRRTGPSQSDQEKQRRIAARAAKAMAQQINRRRNCRSLLVWGDGKKAVIKRYPDGTQEIMVPQTLTRDQELYQFPPRSRLLKKLASVAADHRQSSFAEPAEAHLPHPLAANHTPPHVSANHPFFAPPTPMPAPSPPKLDPLAVREWFSQDRHEQQQRQQQQKVVDWIAHVEQTTAVSRPPSVPADVSPFLPGILLQSRAGRAHGRAGSLCSRTSRSLRAADDRPWTASAGHRPPYLEPPPENNRKHYIPLRCLHTAQPQHPHRPSIQPPQRISKAPDMLRLVDSLHKTLQAQQQQAQQRMSQLESLLLAEQQRRKRVQGDQQWRLERIEQSLAQSQRTSHPQRPRSANVSANPVCRDLADRVSHLERSVAQEGVARQDLYKAVTAAVQHLDTLQQTMNEHAEQSRADRSSLEQKLDQTLSAIQSLKKAKAPSEQLAPSTRRPPPARKPR